MGIPILVFADKEKVANVICGIHGARGNPKGLKCAGTNGNHNDQNGQNALDKPRKTLIAIIQEGKGLLYKSGCFFFDLPWNGYPFIISGSALMMTQA